MIAAIFPQMPIGSLVEKVSKAVEVQPKTVYHQIGIRSHGKGLFDKPPVTGTQLGNKRVFWIEPNCFVVNIVFAWEQAVGKTMPSDVGKIASHRFPMYRPKLGKVDIDFLTYLFKTEYGKELLGLASPGGAGRNKTLGQSEFLKIRIHVPPIAEQRRIAEILSTWDLAIAVQERLVANARAQKKALMQQLLTGKKRLPGFEGEWKTVRLGDCANSQDNKRVPLNGEQRQTMQGDIPYYGANGVVDHINDYIFDEPLVLLAEDGGYFDEYETRPIAQLVRGKSWVNNHAHILSERSEAKIEWIFFSLVHRNILDFVNGGTRAKLNKSDMLQIPMKLPDIDEQSAICSVLKNSEKNLIAHTAQRDVLSTQKSALMQQLLTGKRRVKVEEQ